LILYDSQKRKENNLNFYLIFGNKTEVFFRLYFLKLLKEDLILYEKIEDLKKSMNLKTFYVAENFLDKSKISSDIGTGLITPEYIRKIFPEPNENLFVLSCGSKIMNNTYIKPTLLRMGYKEDYIHLY
jgi:NAD(P)H-flavin reductase